jgi:5-methylcytosine-specific restriction endonuclease McrA
MPYKDPEKERERLRKYRQVHHDEILAKSRKWYHDHLEEEHARGRKYRSENPEKIKETSKRYRTKHPEKIKERSIKYLTEHGENKREYNRKYSASHREACRAKIRRYYARHSKELAIRASDRRTKLNGGGGSHTDEQWKIVLDNYGMRCLACGETGVKLTKDHILPVILGGSNDISNIQPLCKPCNSRKHAKYIDHRPEAYWRDWT